MKKRHLAAVTSLLFPAQALAQTWTPLISASDFTGIRTDLLTAVAGIIALLLIIAGVALLSKIFR